MSCASSSRPEPSAATKAPPCLQTKSDLNFTVRLNISASFRIESSELEASNGQIPPARPAGSDNDRSDGMSSRESNW
jgi:hypothetical protein